MRHRNKKRSILRVFGIHDDSFRKQDRNSDGQTIFEQYGFPASIFICLPDEFFPPVFEAAAAQAARMIASKIRDDRRP